MAARPLPDSPSPPEAPRLQKLLAHRGLGSRREIEEWIRAGRVSVNGTTAGLGTRAAADDLIRIDGRPVAAASGAGVPRVLLYHKPEGEIVTHDDPAGRPTVFDRLPRPRSGKWLAVGRLDFNTGGLLVLTTSGELANRMMHPRYGLDREYSVRIRGRVAPGERERLLNGIQLDDGTVRFELLEEQGGEGANRWYRVVVREGRNRVVRRAFAALGLTVSRLLRTRFGPVVLPPHLNRGRWQELGRDEVRGLLKAVGAPTPERSARPRPAAPQGTSERKPPRRAADRQTKRRR